MPTPAEQILHFGARGKSQPLLSVLTPFYHDDPTALLAQLSGCASEVEIILLDDGSSDAALLARVVGAAEAIAAPVTIIVAAHNRGRSGARNRLVEQARGDYVLFLDADMAPDAPDFLARWLDCIKVQRPGIAFGGLSVENVAPTPQTRLHYEIFARSDCRRASQREKSPAQFVATANLLVRRSLLDHIQFDSAFAGWGWEDVDWALRTAERAAIVHIDNPASHAGLDTVDTLLRKYAEGGKNFARLVHKHPVAVRRFASYRAASALKHAPLRSFLRKLTAWCARDLHAAPMRWRAAALKLYRTLHYAEHLP